jgi:hypothetical protein
MITSDNEDPGEKAVGSGAMGGIQISLRLRTPEMDRKQGQEPSGDLWFLQGPSWSS